jgi:putative chitinase
MAINRGFFFNHARKILFAGSFKQAQVDGLTALLDYWETNSPNSDDRHLAYVLGTAHHEVGRTMQPINEWGGNKYFFEMYDKAGNRPKKAKELGNTEDGDGVRYHGRGFVQVTGRGNYRRIGAAVGVDLEGSPELALDLDVATRVIFVGMTQGLFTGRKLADYDWDLRSGWESARSIVNGKDKKALIADYAEAYYSAISYTTG